MYKMKGTLLVLFALIFGFCGAASAQVNTGSISGTVHDASGAAIVGAAVSAQNVATGEQHSTVSGDIGQYTMQGLPPGTYRLRASHTSFKTFEATVVVTVGSNTTVIPDLEVGASSSVVEVSASYGTETNTQTQELSQLVDSTQLSQLPSLNRNAYDFVILSGNVSNGDNTTASSDSGQNLSTRGVGYSINGQRESGTEILLDGVENVSIFSVAIGQNVPVDSIQEFSIITNNFSAEYGRASGGVVNVDTKSGTNAIHGSAFEYNRLSAYTANTFNNDVNDLPKGIYTRNQFGYSGGGPILKNKLFAFFSEEFVRVRSSSSQTEEILDPAFISMLPANIQSYFSSFGKTSLTPSGKVTTAGELAGTAAAPNGFPLINGVTAVPASTPVFDTVNFSAPFDAGGGVPQNTYNLLGRLDYSLTATTQMFFRFARYSENDFLGSAFYTAYPQYNVGQTNFDNSGLYSISHSFTPNLLSNTKGSFTRFNGPNSNFNTALTGTPNLYLSTGAPVDPVTGTLIQMPGLENIAVGLGGLPVGGPQNTWQFSEDLTWTKGRHNMTFGGQFTYIQLNYAYGAYAQAVEQLGNTLATGMNSLVNAGGVKDPSSGAFASPLVAFTARVNPNGVLPCATDIYGNSIQTPSCTVTPPLTSPSYARSYRYKDWALYAGDSFKLSRRLTLNYAFRYEHYGVQHNDIQSLDSNFYPGPGTGAFESSIRTGSVQITTASPVGQFWAPRWNTPAPRVGFAYDVFGNGKTALRGGFGISYERNFGNVTYNASFNPPASAVLSDVCSATNSVVTNCGFFATNNNLGPLGLPGPSSALTPLELRDNDSHINVAQTQFWSLAVERQLAVNTVLSVSYSGAHAIHLYDLNNYNNLGGAQAYLGDPLVTGPACPFSNPTTGAPTCYTRANSQYAAINDRGSNGTSSYNALNLKFQTQDLHHTGVSIIANYTYAHSLDDISSTFSDSLQGGSGYIGPLGYTDPTHPQLDWGSSDYDIRHRIVLSPIWQTPWFKSGRGILPQTLGGWNISGIFTARTGTPFSVFDYTYDLTGYVVPRLIPATPITQFHVGTPVNVGPNVYNALTIPAPANTGPLNPTLGLSDYGPFPADMTARNSFRGPGAWNTDAAVQKNFKLTERFGLLFRMEGFDLFNHHNYYVNTTTLYYTGGAASTPLQVVEEKGGLGTLATGGNHDERRFGQFSLRLTF
jgi:Carboxypeptidase regulatory-like domain